MDMYRLHNSGYVILMNEMKKDNIKEYMEGYTSITDEYKAIEMNVIIVSIRQSFIKHIVTN